MAFPVIASKTDAGNTSTKNHTFTVPLGVQAGDLLIAWVSGQDASTGTISPPAGWTQMYQQNVATVLTTGFWKIATGAETTVPFSTPNTCTTAVVCVLIRGHDPAQAPVWSGAATDLNALSLTPAWGAQDTLWLDVGHTLGGAVAANKFPSGYTLAGARGVGGGAGARTTVFKRERNAATEDPGVIGYESAVGGRARVTAVKPLPPAPIDAAFDANPTGEPLEMQFIDMSSGGPPLTWSWSFGDSTTSTLQDPRKTYAAAGTYTVTLVASNGAITDTYVEVVTVEAPAGRPDLTATIGDQDLTCFLTTARWTTGREGWLQPIEPANCTLTLNEDVSVEVGDRIYLACQYGLLWTGYVTEVNVDQDPNGFYTTTVTGTDILGLFGQSDLVKVTLAAGDILAKVNALALLDGRTVTMQTGTSRDMTWPSLLAQTNYEGNAIGALQQYEDSSNAILVAHPRDVIVAQKRIALPDPVTYLPLALDGPDCPSLWRKQRATVRVLNDFIFLDAAGLSVGSYLYTDSVAKYGRRTFSAPVLVASMSQQAWMDVASEPRYVVPAAQFHVHSEDQQVHLLQPLDFVTFEGEDWQVMRVSHDVKPGRWDMTLAVDVTQNVFEGEVDPDPDTPPPPGTSIVTTQGDSSTDAYVLLHSNGNKMGAGADNNLPVGYWQGSKYRTLVAFPGVSVPAGVVSVRKATLTCKTSTQVKVGFGSSPKFKVQAIKQSWSEGSASSPSTGNAVKWPGPDASTTSQVTKSVTRNQNTVVSIGVTGIVAAMLDSSALSLSRGFRLISVNEGSSGSTTEFKSQDGGSPFHLTVDWVVANP